MYGASSWRWDSGWTNAADAQHERHDANTLHSTVSEFERLNAWHMTAAEFCEGEGEDGIKTRMVNHGIVKTRRTIELVDLRACCEL